MRSGYIALAVDNIKDFYVDDLKAKPLPCFKDSYDPSVLEQLNPPVIRFYEKYRSEIDTNWF